MFPYVEFCLWDAMDDGSNFQRNFSIGEVELEPDAIYHKSEYRERRNHYAVFWANRPYDGFDTARDAFIGLYGARLCPKRSKTAAAPILSPTAGRRSARCSSIWRCGPASRGSFSLVSAMWKTRRMRNSPRPA